MKKIISLILVALFALSAITLTACSINSQEVSILWSDKGEVLVPDSLINCIERAMYIENISYKHYGSNGSHETQLAQAKEAVKGGCAALVVEPADPTKAGEFVAVAKEKDVPLIFIGNVAKSVLDSYEKCVAIYANDASVAKTQGKLIADYVKANFEKLDRNEDGKISYVDYTGLIPTGSAAEANKLLKEDADYEIEIGGGCNKEKTRTELVFYDDKNPLKYLSSFGADFAHREIMEKYNDKNKNTVELVITADDTTALKILETLQSFDFNTNKLETHFIPVFTVGFEADYKNYVLAKAPIDAEKRAEYLENNKYLCDLTTVAEEDLEVMIWNTKNVIGSGRLAGTVIEDQDAIAAAIAATVRNFIKGNSAFNGLDEKLVEGKKYLINYIPN